MATPHVTGAAALVASANPSLTSSQIRTILLGTARPLAALEGKTVTGGLLDVQAAVNQAIGTQAAYTVYGYVLKHLKGVRGVRVTVVSSDKSFKETTKTASDGAYRFDDLPAGSYTLSAQKTSTHFKKARYLLTVLTNQRQNFQVKP
jgi:subtilisin family serine protease